MGMKIPWYSACLFIFIFLFRTNRQKGHLDGMTMISVTVMVIFFESWTLKVNWSQPCSKFLLKNYEAHWHQHFERYPTIEYRTWINVRDKSFIKNLVNIMKRKSIKTPVKISIPKKFEFEFRRNCTKVNLISLIL